MWTYFCQEIRHQTTSILMFWLTAQVSFDGLVFYAAVAASLESITFFSKSHRQARQNSRMANNLQAVSGPSSFA